MNPSTEISPSTQLLIAEMRKLFDEHAAKWDRRFAEMDAARDRQVLSRGDSVPIPAAAIGVNVPADNWGGRFDGVAAAADNWGGLFDGDGADLLAPSTASISPMTAPSAATLADNWGGLFEQPARVVEERVPDNSGLDTARTSSSTSAMLAPAPPADTSVNPYRREFFEPEIARDAEHSRTLVACAEQERHAAILRVEALGANGRIYCGSSHEHAPIALGAAGSRCVVAASYRRNFLHDAEVVQHGDRERLHGDGVDADSSWCEIEPEPPDPTRSPSSTTSVAAATTPAISSLHISKSSPVSVAISSTYIALSVGAQKVFVEMALQHEVFVEGIHSGDFLHKPVIYSITLYTMRLLCCEINNGVVGSWFGQSQLSAQILLEAFPWVVQDRGLTLSKSPYILQIFLHTAACKNLLPDMEKIQWKPPWISLLQEVLVVISLCTQFYRNIGMDDLFLVLDQMSPKHGKLIEHLQQSRVYCKSQMLPLSWSPGDGTIVERDVAVYSLSNLKADPFIFLLELNSMVHQHMLWWPRCRATFSELAGGITGAALIFALHCGGCCYRNYFWVEANTANCMVGFTLDITKGSSCEGTHRRYTIINPPYSVDVFLPCHAIDVLEVHMGCESVANHGAMMLQPFSENMVDKEPWPPPLPFEIQSDRDLLQPNPWPSFHVSEQRSEIATCSILLEPSWVSFGHMQIIDLYCVRKIIIGNMTPGACTSSEFALVIAEDSFRCQYRAFMSDKPSAPSIFYHMAALQFSWRINVLLDSYLIRLHVVLRIWILILECHISPWPSPTQINLFRWCYENSDFGIQSELLLLTGVCLSHCWSTCTNYLIHAYKECSCSSSASVPRLGKVILRSFLVLIQERTQQKGGGGFGQAWCKARPLLFNCIAGIYMEFLISHAEPIVVFLYFSITTVLLWPEFPEENWQCITGTSIKYYKQCMPIIYNALQGIILPGTPACRIKSLNFSACAVRKMVYRHVFAGRMLHIMDVICTTSRPRGQRDEQLSACLSTCIVQFNHKVREKGLHLPESEWFRYATTNIMLLIKTRLPVLKNCTELLSSIRSTNVLSEKDQQVVSLFNPLTLTEWFNSLKWLHQIKELFLPWDLGVSNLLHRLGGKRKLKKGRMLGTCHGWAVIWAVGLAQSRFHLDAAYKSKRGGRKRHRIFNQRTSRYQLLTLRHP